MKAETCTFEVVSLIMYYKQINEKLTCIRKRHTKGGQITHTSLFYIFLIICNLYNQ